MIIDAHAHLVAPAALYAHRSNLVVSGGQYGSSYRAQVSDRLLEESADQNVRIMDAVGTDLQLLSPRPFLTLNGTARWNDIVDWTSDTNDMIARTVRMHPNRFRGVGALPQQVDRPVTSLFEEIERVVDELGFVGVLLNPDPSEGMNGSPPLGDPYWYPLYEKLCELDLPAHIHSGQCCNGRETYDEHFIAEEGLAITSIYRADVFDRFPDLKLMISHGGGPIPYQIGRWRSHREMARAQGRIAADAPQFDEILRKFWFDTVLHNPDSLALLFKTVGHDRSCFGTERPGSGDGINPVSGRHYDDLKPVIEALPSLDQAALNGVFEGNARRLFSRLNV
ncbi:MAG: amidohydrolase [Novosphingobium sp. SCN 66-18]|nr:MAG: amidohydrolase [Novosphingobium sp. SCN 66-18]